MLDLARRVYDHSFRIDPVIRSLLDTDFYKLLMAQTILRRHPRVETTFGITNRSARVRIAEEVDAGLLREQLDHARSLRLSKGEVTWLRGNVFRGQGRILGPEFVSWFETFQLPEYELATRDGQYELTSTAPGSRPRCGRCQRSRSSTSCGRGRCCGAWASWRCRCSTPAP